MANEVVESDTREIAYTLPAPVYSREASLAMDLAKNISVETGPTEREMLEPLPSDIRGTLSARQNYLAREMRHHDHKLKGLLISDMLGCYGPPKPDENMKQTVAKFVMELKGQPTWAVSLACQAIKVGGALNISLYLRPTTIQLVVECQRHTARYREEMSQIAGLLSAKPYRPWPTAEEKERVIPKFNAFAAELSQRVQEDGPSIKGLRRQRELNERFILAEYRALGIEPVVTGGSLVAPSLLRSIGALPRRSK